jgi:hypothetical protein
MQIRAPLLLALALLCAAAAAAAQKQQVQTAAAASKAPAAPACAAPLPVPAHVKGKALGATELRFSWGLRTPAASASGGGCSANAVAYYLVEAAAADQSPSSLHVQQSGVMKCGPGKRRRGAAANGLMQQFVVCAPNLMPSTKYNFYIRSQNQLKSAQSEFVSVTATTSKE